MKEDSVLYLAYLLSVVELLHLQKPRFTAIITVAKNIQYDFWGPSKFGGPGLQPFLYNSHMADPALSVLWY